MVNELVVAWVSPSSESSLEEESGSDLPISDAASTDGGYSPQDARFGVGERSSVPKRKSSNVSEMLKCKRKGRLLANDSKDSIIEHRILGWSFLASSP